LNINRDNLNVGWLLSYPTNVLSPYIDFNLHKEKDESIDYVFPLFIEYVTLGPKHPEPETNIIQYEHLIEKVFILLPPNFKQSKITSYR